MNVALRTSLLAAAIVVGCPASLRADVWRVPSQMANLKIAVAAAAPGDVILVAPGDYLEAVEVAGKGVSLVADGGPVGLASLEVHDVPDGQTFVLDGFRIQLPAVFSGPDVPFVAADNPGALRIQDCEFLGDDGFAGFTPGGLSAFAGTPGARVLRSRDVVFDGCRMQGGDGASLLDADLQVLGTAGGPGLEVDEARLLVSQCELRGGRGGDQDRPVFFDGGNGGSGLVGFASSFLIVIDSVLQGGPGGDAQCGSFGCGTGGWGGDGLQLTSGLSPAWLRGNTYLPGPGGGNGDGVGQGPDGEDVRGGDALDFGRQARRFVVETPVDQGQAARMSLDGMPGEVVLLFGALDTGFMPRVSNQGVFTLGETLLFPGVFAGVLPASGSDEVPVAIPDLPGLDAIELFLQVAYVSPGGAVVGASRVLTLLDPSL